MKKSRIDIYRSFSYRMAAFFLLIFLILLASSPLRAADNVIDWFVQFGDSVYTAPSTIVIDSANNLYTLGSTYGTFPGQSSSGGRDAFVRKSDSNGNLLWIRQFGTSDEEAIAGAAVDQNDNLYAVGSVWGPLPGQSYFGLNDSFVRKYDPSGTEIWTRQFGNPDLDWASAVAVDSLNNLYVVGSAGGALPGQAYLGNTDVFVRKYDPSGTEIWTRQFGTSSYENVYEVTLDSSDNLYLIGDVGGVLPGQSALGARDAFIRKYDASGTEIWTRQFGTSGEDEGRSATLDSSDNLYIVGRTNGTFPGENYSGGERDAFIRKYDAGGNELWTHQFGTAGNDFAAGIVVDSMDSLYIAGWVGGALPGQSYFGWNDSFVRKYDPSGTEIWTNQFGTSSYENIYDLALDSSENLYVFGETDGSLPGQTPSGGWFDAFIAKFGALGNTPAGPDEEPVTVILDDEVGVTFGDVTAGGETVLTTDTIPVSDPPSNFKFRGVQFNISTDAEYTPPVLVTVPYDDSSLPEPAEANLKLFHWNGSNWEDVTVSVDTENNLITGEVDSLSPFIVGQPVLPANVDIDANTLNLKSKGNYITAYIEVPEGYDVFDVDVSSVEVDGRIPAELSPTNVGDYDKDGSADLMVKFDRDLVQDKLDTGSSVVLKITGYLPADGIFFEGTDTIKVIDKGKNHTDNLDPASVEY